MNKKVKAVLMAILLGIFVIVFPVFSGIIATVCKISAPGVYYLQAGFMIVPIVIFLCVYFIKKMKKEDFYLNLKLGKELLFFLIPLVVFIPLMIKGFVGKDITSFFGIFLLYLSVGICEELYYRSIITKVIINEFSPIITIVISSLIFGLGHMAVAFSGTDLLGVILTIVNALFFGLMAGSLLYLTNTVYPLMLIHFLFDFESKFINMDGELRFACEIVQGTLLALIAIALFTIALIKEKKNRTY